MEGNKIKTNATHNLLSKDTLNTFQQRLQRFATLETQGNEEKRGPSKASVGKENIQSQPTQQFWSGSCDLKAPIQQTMTSSRAKPLSKPLSPQLNKSPVDFGFLRDNSSGDNSYIKKVKQALLERAGQSEKIPSELRFSPKTKENLELLNLKKLKNITSGHNMFVNQELLTSALGLEAQDKLNKSATGGRPLFPEKQYNPKGTSLFSTEVLKPRANELDVSRSSVNSREKSTSVSKNVHKQITMTPPQTSKEAADKDQLNSNPEDIFEVVQENMKASRFKLLSRLEETVFHIYNTISQDRDPYETIRAYSDIAQDGQFNELEKMLKVKLARQLYSRLLKLERWLVVYLFYFTIQENEKERHKLLMLDVSDMLYSNLSFVVAWTQRILEKQGISSQQFFKGVSVQVAVSQYKAVAYVEAAQKHVSASLKKLGDIASGISKPAAEFLSMFCKQIDTWSPNTAFEKAFEGFYDAFIQKGVISVNYQDKENNYPRSNAVSDTNKPNPKELDEILKDTPKKTENLMRKLDELSIERKSFGDKLIIQELRDMNGIQMGSVYIDKIDSPCFLFQPDTHKVKQKKPLLPSIRPDRLYTLVLDLDETLIHFEENPDGTSQFLIRPYAQNFLKEVSKHYELVIFTAALKDYADFILDRLDTEQFISHRLYRPNCSFSENVYQKDLSKLGRDLSRTLIVDNNAENFQQQPDNGIYIKSWYNDPNDEALKKLAPLLADIVKKGYSDVRIALKKYKEQMLKKLRDERHISTNFTLSIERPPGMLD